MPSYVSSVLLGNEKVVFSTSLHWIVYIYGVLFVLGAGVLSAFAPSILTSFIGAEFAADFHPFYLDGVLILTGLGCVFLLFEYLKQISTELAVTDRRVIAKFGFISRTTYELFLDKVEGANVDQTFWGRILGYGSVLVKGTGGGISPIHNVANPIEFQKSLLDMVNRAKK